MARSRWAHCSAVDTRSSSNDLPIKPPNVERPGWVDDDASLGGCDWGGKRTTPQQAREASPGKASTQSLEASA